MAKKKDIPESSTTIPISVPIVAIGASAGGQEAVVELLQNLSPTTGFAYVYIQHLDPKQKIRLVDVLGRATSMVVQEAAHLMRVEPNCLYIIPPDRDLEVLDGVLTLQSRQNHSGIHMPIDQFFMSLAERQKEGAIAIVLSGTASDGTLGMRAIKAAGGITFAQDNTAQFQSMPRSAIIEGMVDRVLPPAEISRELEQLSHQAALFAQTSMINEEADNVERLPNDLTEASDEDLRKIIHNLRRIIGVDFSHYKMTTIRRRIIRRTLLYKLNSLSDYAEYLRQHSEEAALLYDDLLINVTTFFRDAETMDYIQRVVLPRLVREKPASEPIRIWIPACSTGQEAYSLAMLLLEVLGEQAVSRSIQLFATDLSESAVVKARLGSYTRGEVMDVSPRRLQRFFTKVDDHYRVNKSVRDLCVFAPHNLLKDPPFSRLDLISCRNLLIYLDTTLQRKAILTFHYSLNPSGYLVMGKSETVGSSAQLFSQLEKDHKIFLRKNDVDSRVTFTMSPRQLNGDTPPNRPRPAPKTMNQLDNDGLADSAGASFNLDKMVDSLLLNQYMPASVVVNQDMEILQFRGATSLFLEPAQGKASLNLIKMARPALVFEIRNLIHKAQKANESVRKSGLEFKVRAKIHYVAIEAVPLDTATEERLFLIIFQEIEPPLVPSTQSTSARNNRIKELETELTNLREDMRSIIEEQEASNEELQSANEEIISSNEELQSINEELETSKEEIESTNEELLTINQELQVRNDQLSEAYQFSEDIFRTIGEATLVLDTDLRIKSANPAFYRLFDLTEETTERRLVYELDDRQWDLYELRLMLIDVLTTGAQIQNYELRYVSATVGEKRLSLNARRVVRQQDSILLAIDDITERQRAQQLLAEREAWFHQIADNAPTLIWVTDAEGTVTFLNKVWLAYTGRSQEEVVTHGWVDSLHPDDQSAYQVTYQNHAKKQEAFQAEYRLHRYDGDYHWMLENAQPTFGPDGAFSGYIGSSADVQLQKELNQELDRRVQERTEELAQSHELMRIALEASQAGLNRWDWRDNATIWDKRSREIIGFASDEEMRHRDGWLNRIHPDDRERVEAQTQESMKAGQDFRAEYRVVHDDGSVHYVLGTGRMKQDGEGKPLESMGLVIDITPLKQAQEERFRVSEEQRNNILSLFSQAPVALAIFKGPTFVIDMANEQVLQFWGRTREQVMHKPLFEALPEATGQGYEELLKQVYTTGQRFMAHEMPVDLRRNGKLETTYINFVYEPYYDVNNNLAGVMVVASEITEQVVARRRIEESARRLSTLVENTPDVITRWDKDLNLRFANSAFIQKTGQPLSALLGKTNADMGQPGEIAQSYMDSLRKVFETGQPQEHYNPFLTPQGKAQFYSRMVPEIGPDGAIESVLATGRDITELKQTTEHLQAVLNSSPAAIGFLKPIRQGNDDAGATNVIDFCLVVCNAKFAQMTGLPVEQLMNQYITQLSDKLWKEQTIDVIQQVMESGEPFFDERYDLSQDGWMLLTLTKFDGGVVLTGQDITPLKKAEEQQNYLLNELERSDENMQVLGKLRQQLRERGELLRSTSHDLRGNFGIIQGAATLLDMASTDEERAQMLSMLQRNLRQATQMLTELLDVARLEAGQEQRQIVPIRVAELLGGLVESVQPMADERQLWLRVDGHEDLTVEGDPVKVRRIAQNLLLNALKYTQTGGVTVSWGVAATPDYWQLTITDTGPGLPEENRSKSGEGIGLIIVRQLCELLDCRMDIESQLGTGTRFQLLFPRQYTT